MCNARKSTVSSLHEPARFNKPHEPSHGCHTEETADSRFITHRYTRACALTLSTRSFVS